MQQQRFLDKADGARCASGMVCVLQRLGLVALIATIMVSFPGCDGSKKYSTGEYIPRIGSLSPSSGLQGTTVDVTIKGKISMPE